MNNVPLSIIGFVIIVIGFFIMSINNNVNYFLKPIVICGGGFCILTGFLVLLYNLLVSI